MKLEDSSEALEQVRLGSISGRDFLFEQCDEKFWDEDLNDEGNLFTAAYYDAHYVDDYVNTLDSDDTESIYHYANSAENQALVEAVLDRRFADWRREPAGGAPSPKKPWWRFW